MQKYTFKEHFIELKSRIIKVFICFICAFGVSYFYSEYIYEFLLQPLASISPNGTRKIIYTGLAEAFFTYLKLGCFSAFLLTIPVICYQLYAFITPGLIEGERKIISFALFLSPILFFLGGFFVFYLVMPKAWYFFLSFEKQNGEIPLILEARISEYLSIVMQLITAFGLAFQVPIIMLILSVMRIINSEILRKKRRIAIIINFTIAAIFTPPDVLSQIALAIPLLLLYEISILMCKFVEKRGNKNVRS